MPTITSFSSLNIPAFRRTYCLYLCHWWWRQYSSFGGQELWSWVVQHSFQWRISQGHSSSLSERPVPTGPRRVTTQNTNIGTDKIVWSVLFRSPSAPTRPSPGNSPSPKTCSFPPKNSYGPSTGRTPWRKLLKNKMAGPSGRAVWRVGLDCLEAEAVVSNSALGMHVCLEYSSSVTCHSIIDAI
jgi:hypothetical protein